MKPLRLVVLYENGDFIWLPASGGLGDYVVVRTDDDTLRALLDLHVTPGLPGLQLTLVHNALRPNEHLFPSHVLSASDLGELGTLYVPVAALMQHCDVLRFPEPGRAWLRALTPELRRLPTKFLLDLTLTPLFL